MCTLRFSCVSNITLASLLQSILAAKPESVLSGCTGNPGPKNEDAEARAIGAAGLAYFRNRASAPRDLSANACRELREACLEVVKDSY